MSKIMISLPEEILKEINIAAQAEHRTRSEFIREAVRAYLQKGAGYPRPIDNPEIRKAYDAIINNPMRWPGKLDSTQVIRKMRETRYGFKPK